MSNTSNGTLGVRKSKVKGKEYKRYVINLPSDLVDNEDFPFDKVKQSVNITIENNSLVITKDEDN